jgi:hypothetical protein
LAMKLGDLGSRHDRASSRHATHFICVSVSISLSSALNRFVVSGFSSGQGTARGNDPSRTSCEASWSGIARFALASGYATLRAGSPRHQPACDRRAAELVGGELILDVRKAHADASEGLLGAALDAILAQCIGRAVRALARLARGRARRARAASRDMRPAGRDGAAVGGRRVSTTSTGRKPPGRFTRQAYESGRLAMVRGLVASAAIREPPTSTGSTGTTSTPGERLPVRRR